MTLSYMRDLRRKVNETFSEAELKILVDDINIDWDHLVGEEKLTKIQSFLKLLQRDGKLDDLIELLREERAIETWEDPPPKEQQIEDAKADITEVERREIFDDFMKEVGPLITSMVRIRSLFDAKLDYFDTKQTGVLVRLLAEANLAGYVKLESISLVNEDLSNVKLREADLSHANLRGANLHEANLSGANLRDADLSGTDLSGANLRDANLRGANLAGANLIGARLLKADLIRADLTRVDLTGANLRDAYLAGANLFYANLFEADLSHANLRGANLSHASLSGAKLFYAKFGGDNLAEADLTRADLTRADLTRAEVTDDQLAKVTINEITIMPNGEKWKPNKEE